jgi:hypothetical protein
MKKIWTILIIISAIILIILAIYGIPKLSCKLRGGEWETMGTLRIKECNLPTSDADKECSSSNECEGSCIAILSKEDYNKAINGTVYTKGKCTAWEIIVGCQAFVENGEVNGILCID